MTDTFHVTGQTEQGILTAAKTIVEQTALLRELLRPVAVAVLGAWAGDDAQAARAARGWRGLVDRRDDGTVITLVDRFHAVGHNDSGSWRSHTVKLVVQPGGDTYQGA